MKITFSAEDLLAPLLAILDLALRPSPANIQRFFLGGAEPYEIRALLASLARSKYVEKDGRGRESSVRLTEKGRLAAWGGLDPTRRWQRPWDGKWRLLFFDLPARNKALRLRLWRWLRSKHFGCLQLSVWITPDPMAVGSTPLESLKLLPDSMTIMEGKPVLPVADEQIVKAAWDFSSINRHYQAVLDLAGQGEALADDPRVSATQLRRWLAAERQAWLQAVWSDPLLPETLLPKDYLGCKAWTRRRNVFAKLARSRSQLM